MPARVERLGREAARSVASLVAIGRQSGATVVGLSAVRRTKELAFIFFDGNLSSGTVRELSRLADRLWELEEFEQIVQPFGGQNVHVIAIKQGELARGIGAKLEQA